MSSPETIDGKENQTKSLPALGWLSRGIEIAAYPVSAAVAYFTADANVKIGAYKSIAPSNVFSKDKALEREKIAEIPAKVIANPALDGGKEIEAIKGAYRDSVKKTFESMNVKGWRGRWKCLTPNMKINTIAFAAGTSGIVIGAMLTAASHLNKASQSLLDKHTDHGKE